MICNESEQCTGEDQGIIDKSINVMSDVETIKCTVVKMRRESGKQNI